MSVVCEPIPPVRLRSVTVAIDGVETKHVSLEDALKRIAREWSTEVAKMRAEQALHAEATP